MPKVLLVVAPERFRDEEFLVPRAALAEAGARVAVASTRPGRARGMLGAEVAVDLLVSEANPADYDAVVVVGGFGSPTHLWGHEPLLELVKTMYGEGKVVAGICFSGAVLARAGVLAGKRATVFPAPHAMVELQRGGAHYVEEAVVRDGTVLTASGPEAAQAFAKALVRQLPV